MPYRVFIQKTVAGPYENTGVVESYIDRPLWEAFCLRQGYVDVAFIPYQDKVKRGYMKRKAKLHAEYFARPSWNRKNRNMPPDSGEAS
jgi:hypothetical protein